MQSLRTLLSLFLLLIVLTGCSAETEVPQDIPIIPAGTKKLDTGNVVPPSPPRR